MVPDCLVSTTTMPRKKETAQERNEFSVLKVMALVSPPNVFHKIILFLNLNRPMTWIGTILQRRMAIYINSHVRSNLGFSKGSVVPSLPLTLVCDTGSIPRPERAWKDWGYRSY